jgi:hypothetical protein
LPLSDAARASVSFTRGWVFVASACNRACNRARLPAGQTAKWSHASHRSFHFYVLTVMCSEITDASMLAERAGHSAEVVLSL